MFSEIVLITRMNRLLGRTLRKHVVRTNSNKNKLNRNKHALDKQAPCSGPRGKMAQALSHRYYDSQRIKDDLKIVIQSQRTDRHWFELSNIRLCIFLRLCQRSLPLLVFIDSIEKLGKITLIPMKILV